MSHKYVEFIQSLMRFIPDRNYIELKYYYKTGKRIDWNNIQSFNEKMQWLKLYDRKPEYTTLVDKLQAKEYVSRIMGNQYIIPTIGVWDSIEDIDWNTLPEKFVLKTNHDSGGVCICNDKSTFNVEFAKKKLKHHLKHNYYYYGREWPYKYVKRKVFAEQYIYDDKCADINDYKVFTFNGIPRLIQVDFDRFNNHKRNIYDVDWKYQEFELEYPTHPEVFIERPANLQMMLNMAKNLSGNIPFSRIDYYEVNKTLYFGEITLYPGSGFELFRPSEWDIKLGEYFEDSKT